MRTGEGREHYDWKSRKAKACQAWMGPHRQQPGALSPPLGPREVMDEPNLYKWFGLFVF